MIEGLEKFKITFVEHFGEKNWENLWLDFESSGGSEIRDADQKEAFFIVFITGLMTAISPGSRFNKNYEVRK